MIRMSRSASQHKITPRGCVLRGGGRPGAGRARISCRRGAGVLRLPAARPVAERDVLGGIVPGRRSGGGTSVEGFLLGPHLVCSMRSRPPGVTCRNRSSPVHGGDLPAQFRAFGRGQPVRSCDHVVELGDEFCPGWRRRGWRRRGLQQMTNRSPALSLDAQLPSRSTPAGSRPRTGSGPGGTAAQLSRMSAESAAELPAGDHVAPGAASQVAASFLLEENPRSVTETTRPQAPARMSALHLRHQSLKSPAVAGPAPDPGPGCRRG